MPLRALLNDNSFFAIDLSEENRRDQYNCPVCKDNFIPVIPFLNRIKHFRHSNGVDHFSEPETFEHLNLKQIVFSEGKKLGWQANLEVPIGNHITDVVLTSQSNNKPIAIECQCSTITLKEYLDRNFVYCNAGYRSLWIFGGPHFSHIMNPTFHKRGYPIQRIHDIHQTILTYCEAFNKETELFTFGFDHFFEVTDFQTRFNAKKLGWYHKNLILFGKILGRITYSC